jgi:hypothetical protein
MEALAEKTSEVATVFSLPYNESHQLPPLC